MTTETLRTADATDLAELLHTYETNAQAARDFAAQIRALPWIGDFRAQEADRAERAALVAQAARDEAAAVAAAWDVRSEITRRANPVDPKVAARAALEAELAERTGQVMDAPGFLDLPARTRASKVNALRGVYARKIAAL